MEDIVSNGNIVHFIWGKPRKREDEGCINETPVEANFEFYSYLILDKFLSNKMKEKKNDMCAVIRKTVTLKRRKVVPEGENSKEKWLGRYLNKVTG